MERFLFLLLALVTAGAGCATMEGMSGKTKAVSGDAVVEEVTTTTETDGTTTTTKKTYKTQQAADLELKKHEISSRATVRTAEANRPVIVVPFPYYDHYRGGYYDHYGNRHGHVGGHDHGHHGHVHGGRGRRAHGHVGGAHGHPGSR